MLTTLDTTRLIPRNQPGTASNPVTQHDGPVFTIAEIMEILEDRPEIREALRQSLL